MHNFVFRNITRYVYTRYSEEDTVLTYTHGSLLIAAAVLAKCDGNL